MITITTPATNRKLTTIEACRDDLGLKTSDNAVLATLIDQASAMIETFCGRVFALETVTETVRVPVPVDVLNLERWPVAAVTSLTIDGAALGDDAWTCSPATGQVIRLDGQPWSGTVMVSYSAGYVLPGSPGRTLPHDLEQATIAIVRALWFQRGADSSIKNETVDGLGSVQRWVPGAGDGGFPPGVAAALDRHRAAGV